MKTSINFLLFVSFSFFLTTQVSAQPGRGMNKNDITRSYNKATVETITGVIVKIDTAQSGYGRFPGILLTLKKNSQETNVFVAPVWYLEQEKLLFKTGESIAVAGSKVTFQNKPLIITKDFELNTKKYVMRNDDGFPVWAGKRMGPGQGRRAR
ncbi:hypothetical protein JW960_00960 [candidate division KSB1 bacterium]|nr:hypothetical protein [candidate division KSB1 bacterium]